MLDAILYSEVGMVCFLVLLLIALKLKKSMFIQAHKRRLMRVIISNMVFTLIDSVWIFVNSSPSEALIPLNWALNICYYICSGLLGLFWFEYSETVQGSVFVRIKKYRMAAHVPMGLLVALTLASIKTGWLFYIDGGNAYHRGSLYSLQAIISYGYIVFTAAKALNLSRHMDNYRRRKQLKALSSFILPTLLTGGMQVALPRLPLLCVGNMLGILYVFLSLQEQLVSRDALTDLNNRNQFYQHLSTKLAHPNEDKALYLLVIDVDFFKTINDRYGHVEGDRALTLVARALVKACENQKHFVARFGGDEFVAVCELDPAVPIQTVCDDIKANLGAFGTPYELSVSIGSARYTPDIRNALELIERADGELYSLKRGRAR